MRSLSNVASRRFAGVATIRKFSSASNARLTRPGWKVNIDTHGGGPRYRNFSTSNKALEGFAFNPFTKTLPFRKPLPFLSPKCLGIKDADFAWFVALNVAVRTQRNRVYLSHPDGTPRFVLQDYQHTLRVVADADWILRKEQRTHQWARDIDSTLLWVLCMTHDITHDMSDAWYLSSDEKQNQWQIVREFTRAAGCPPNIIWHASCLAARLSGAIQFDEQRFTVTNFSHEQPIHRILRDAYHLQRLGAVGVARYFYFHGTDEGYREPGVGFDVSCLRHMHGGQYVERMTTETGAEMAHQRYMWTTHKFLNGWDAENDVGSVVTGRGFR